MRKLFFAVLTFCSLSALAQKTVYDPNAEVRPVTAFHALHVSNAFEVVITQGSEEGLAVSASRKEDIAHIKTEVANGVLRISFDDNKKWWSKNGKLKAYVSVRTLDNIRASGACDIKVEGGLRTNALALHLSGASDLSGQLTVSGALNVHLNGASDINIAGSADQVAIDLNGASEVRAFDFRANTCKVEASGASGVRITVDKELSAQLSGASSVSYKGAAVIRDIRTSGASNIRKS